METTFRRGRDGRRFPRAPFARPMHFFEAGRPIPATAREIGGGGLFVHTDTPLPEGRFVTVRFDLPDEAPPVTALCRVVRTVRGSASGRKLPGMGIEFVDIRYSDRRRLLSCIAARGGKP